MKSTCVILCTVVVLLGLQACTGCNSESHSGRKVFRYNQASGISSLDPAFASDLANIWAVNQLYNSLLQLDDSLRIQPCIAKHYSISDDGLSYTFTLRDDVFFHDDACFANGKGRKVTATDVVYSFERLVNPQTLAKGAWVFNGRVDTVEPFKAVNDTVFQLRLLKPFMPMAGILTMQYCSVIPREAVEAYGSTFRAHPVGTGPFKFNNWKEGVALILVKNENYFETLNGQKLPLLDGVKVTFVDNTKSEFLNFKQKNLDFISGIDGAYIDEVLDDNGEVKAEWKERFNYHKGAYLNTEYFCFLMKDSSEFKLLQNKKLRQAINYGFNREQMIKYLRNGIGRAATYGFVPLGIAGYTPSAIQGYTYNPDRCKQLLAEAGYPNGKNLPEIKLYTSDKYAEYALFVSKQLEQCGIKIKVELLQSSLLKEMKANGKAGFFRASLVADYADPETFFAAFYSKHIAPPNYSRFHNNQFDKWYEQAVQEKSDSLRQMYYRQMDSLLIEEAPIVPLYYDEALRFTQKNVHGLSPNPMNLLNLKAVSIP